MDISLALNLLFILIETPLLCAILYIEWLDWQYDTDVILLKENLELFKKNNEILEEIKELLKNGK